LLLLVAVGLHSAAAAVKLTEAQLRQVLDEIDSDDDNVVERDELIKWIARNRKDLEEQQAQSLLKKYDSDGDSQLSYNELMKHFAEDGDEESERELQYIKQLFDAADRDDDDELNLEELISFRSPERDSQLRDIKADYLLDELDTDGDDKLSAAEAASLVSSPLLFDKEDEDDDGLLNKDELDDIIEPSIKGEVDAMMRRFSSADDDGDLQLTVEELLEEPHLFVGTPLEALVRGLVDAQQGAGRHEL